VDPSKNKTVPLGVVVETPWQDAPATVAEILTVWPKFDGLGAVLRVIVVDPFTTWLSEIWELPYTEFGSLNPARIWWVPSDKLEVVKLAVPRDTEAVPKAVLPS
jgi:hypothetical protein